MHCEFSSNSDIWKGKNVEMEIQGLQHQELGRENTVLKRAVFTDSYHSRGYFLHRKIAVTFNSFSLYRWGCL